MNKMRRINPINCLVKSQLLEIEFNTVRGCFEWPWWTPICIRSSTESLSIDYGGRTKRGLTDWAYRTSTRERVPLPFYRKGGREGFAQDLYSGRI